MKGLLLKDYYLIRDGMVILLLTFVAVGAGLAFLTSPWVLIVVAGATMSFQGAMTVQSDRSTQWDRFSAVLPLPHPSPRNNLWLRRNPWFEAEVLPALRQRVAEALG